MKEHITREAMETLAKRLNDAKEQGKGHEGQVEGLHSRFLAEDGSGVTWSCGIKSGRWHRVLGGSWVRGTPQNDLLIDGAVLQEAAALLPAGGPTCAKCGAELKTGAKFCGSCGAPAEGAGSGPPPLDDVAHCPNCGSVAKKTTKFCGRCGTPMA